VAVCRTVAWRRWMVGPSASRAAASHALRRCAVLWDVAPLGHAACCVACSMRRACVACCMLLPSFASTSLQSERRTLRCASGMPFSSPSDRAQRSCAEDQRWRDKHDRRQRNVRLCGDLRSLRRTGALGRGGRSGPRRSGAAEGCADAVVRIWCAERWRGVHVQRRGGREGLHDRSCADADGAIPFSDGYIVCVAWRVLHGACYELHGMPCVAKCTLGLYVVHRALHVSRRLQLQSRLQPIFWNPGLCCRCSSRGRQTTAGQSSDVHQQHYRAHLLRPHVPGFPSAV
jgi:hypothetical protein